MAGFIRRFSQFPSLDVITEIESVDIVDLVPSGVFAGRTTGTVALVGEWPDGPVNTPTEVEGDRTIQDTFGGFSLATANPLSYAASAYTNPFSNGNSFAWLKSKSFRRLILVRVDMDLAEGANISLGGTVPGGGTALLDDLELPAGTRVRDASATDVEFALSRSVTFAAGTDLAVSASTAYAESTVSYATRTIEGIPVVSTKNTPESAVGDVDAVDASDLFRAGIGAGTDLPSVTVSASTGALDGAAANSAVLTPLTSAQIDTAYENAIDALLPGEIATDNIEIVASARTSDAIRTKLRAHVAEASAQGAGRSALIRPEVGTLPAAARGATTPGVGTYRSDRVFYCYPHFEQRLSELTTLDPQATISSENVLVGADAAAANILSNLPPENNPGQSTQELISGGLLTYVRKLEDGLTGAGLPTKFTLDDYKLFKSSGMMALRRDNRLGEWIFQSGVTSVDPTLDPGKITVKRRRMADFIQDSCAAIALKYNKLPATDDRVDSLVGELFTFLDDLLSTDNPARQRIADFRIDSTSGNTDSLAAAGILVIIIEVRLLGTLDNIVLQTTIGENVEIIAQDAVL